MELALKELMEETAAIKDLRDWIEKAEQIGELKRVNGAHWDVEIGAITDYAHRKQPVNYSVLFDKIKDYPPGFRVLSNPLGSLKRVAITTGLPMDMTLQSSVPTWRQRTANLQMIPPRFVKDGPVMENVLTGDKVNMLMFPAPRWHEEDGGRYIGTGSVDITRDPDSDWVNLGVYRCMVKDEKHICFYISPGKNGRIHRQKYFDRKKPCPVAVSFGHDPLVYMVGGLEVPNGVCEYDYIGGLKGEPVDVIRGPVTGLPIPANAEIVIEGFATEDYVGEEGPFGEWTGYYASSHRLEPLIKVEAVYHRNDPIILGTLVTKPPAEPLFYRTFMRAGLIQEELEKAGIPDVTKVWCHEAGGSRLLVVVGIKQRYPGHAKQAALVASQCRAGAYLGRYVVVVDDDIDVTSLNDVMWAMCTRVDPVKDIDILRRTWSGPLDPIIPVGEKGFNSRAIFDATRPWEWKEQFPHVAEVSPELHAMVDKKWGKLFE